MEPISLTIAIAPLVIDWAKERRKRGQDATEEEFRAWFRDVAIPQLLDASSTTFRALVISEKAHHHELLEFLTQQFSGIRSALNEFAAGQPRVATFDECWRRLGKSGQALLQGLANQVEGDSHEDAQLDAPFCIEGETPANVRAGVRRLEEAKLVINHEHSGGATLRLTGLGYLVATAVRSQDDFESQLIRIQDGLRRYSGLTVGKLVAHSKGRCSAVFVYAVIACWDGMGLVTLQKLDHQTSSRISPPTQTLLDATPQDLVKGTLRAFLKA